MLRSLLLRFTLTAAILALAMTAVTLWLCRFSFAGLTAMTRSTAAPNKPSSDNRGHTTGNARLVANQTGISDLRDWEEAIR